ncbi:hypothetical protein [Roseivivax isoporae]|uniref:hypothetical protein n=1 Tax=Roseivivax isoporae TaxID=591206 RepID=UPI00138DE5E5|nr:hypothetical protein [Roseivivax isoporae]
MAQILAGLIGLVRDFVMETIRTQRRANLAAIYCAVELEVFCDLCREMQENSELSVNEYDVMDVKFNTQMPRLYLDSRIEWQFLNPHITAWMFRISREAEDVERRTNPKGLPPPDYGNVVEYRRKQCADLYSHALEVLELLRRQYRLMRPVAGWPRKAQGDEGNADLYGRNDL